MGADRSRLRLLPWLAAFSLAAACASHTGPVAPELEVAAKHHNALAVSDALEGLIADGKDTPRDREYAYEVVKLETEDTAPATFARAAVAGRLVQQRGLLGANLVADVEQWARHSRELDPNFRDGAATRLLGTLYVIAPASFLKHGDSEEGLGLLEGLVHEHPASLENHLRLAEAYVALGDLAPAGPHLCVVLEGRTALRHDDQHLLDQLLTTAGTPPCVAGR
jgi:hypothetical protein